MGLLGGVLERTVGSTFRRKLVIAFLGVAVLTAAVGAVGVVAVSDTSDSTTAVGMDYSQQVDGVMMLKLESQRERASLYRYVREEEPGAREEFQGAREKFLRIFDERLASRDTLTDRQREILEQVKATHAEAVSVAQSVFEAVDDGNREQALERLERYEELQNELESLLGPLEKETKGVLAAEVESAQSTAQTATGVMGGLTLLAFVGALAIGSRVGGSAGAELRRLRDVSERIAAGRVEFSVDSTDRADEFGDLSTAFSEMTDYLSVVTDQATAVADQRFDDAALDREVPGEFGDVMDQMVTDVETNQRELARVNESLRETADEYGAVMDAAAEGDLTRRIDPDTDVEAMQEIGEAFDEMMDDIEATVATLASFTAEVRESTETVREGAREIGRASESVSEDVQDIARQTDENTDRLREANRELQSLSGSVEQIASAADEVAQTADRAAQRSQSGREAATEAIDRMDTIESTADETVGEVEALAEEVDQIGEIVELIDEIAEQTNMLALNASIEAARAGEAGEGFAVVADEIKGLATEVSEATDEIEGLIGDVQASTDQAVTDMRDLGEEVTENADTIEGALGDFEEVVGVVEEVNGGIQEINSATDDQAASTEEAVSVVEQVAERAESANDAAQSVSGATQEQAASVQQINDKIQTLADGTDELERVLSEFTVEGDGQTAPTADAAATGDSAVGATDDD